jgi:ubiquinone/menaquinone biosynthesis C-methylase UbiE
MESSKVHTDGGAHQPFSASRAFELNNPFKRLFDRSPQKFIKLLGIKPDWSLVDFGCGPGFYTIPFARVAQRVVAVDVQPEMLKKAETYAKKSRVKVELVESDGTRIPLSDSTFDLVFLSLVYHEIADKKSALVEFLRLLKPGGIVAIREKTENTLFPVGPPVTPVELIQSELESAGFVEVHTAGNRERSLVVGLKPSMS